MASDAEVEAARCAIRDAIRAYWDETNPEKASQMVDGYRAMARAALDAAERVRDGPEPGPCVQRPMTPLQQELVDVTRAAFSGPRRPGV